MINIKVLIGIVGITLLAGCSSIFTMNVMPTLTPEVVAEKSAECVKKNLIPEPYPADKPQVVFCKTKSVLPPGYVSPVPYVRTI